MIATLLVHQATPRTPDHKFQFDIDVSEKHREDAGWLLSLGKEQRGA